MAEPGHGRILVDDRPLPPGQTGAIVVNGPSRFLGFLGNEELTRVPAYTITEGGEA